MQNFPSRRDTLTARETLVTKPSSFASAMASAAPPPLSAALLPSLHRSQKLSVPVAIPVMRADSTESSRKRPIDVLSPLPSPLFSFLPSHSLALLPRMNSIDLSAPSRPDIGGSSSHSKSASGSLKFVLPAATKRPRHEPSSPQSVGDMGASSGTEAQPRPASASVQASTTDSAPTPSSAPSEKIRSVVRGLEHISRCSPSGCNNPLCVSTRAFVGKVTSHLVSMSTKPGHDPDKCNACQLWLSIVRTHSNICMEAECSIPMCPSGQKHDVPVSVGANDCRRSDQRDDNNDGRFPMVALQ